MDGPPSHFVFQVVLQRVLYISFSDRSSPEKRGLVWDEGSLTQLPVLRS